MAAAVVAWGPQLGGPAQLCSWGEATGPPRAGVEGEVPCSGYRERPLATPCSPREGPSLRVAQGALWCCHTPLRVISLPPSEPARRLRDAWWVSVSVSHLSSTRPSPSSVHPRRPSSVSVSPVGHLSVSLSAVCPTIRVLGREQDVYLTECGTRRVGRSCEMQGHDSPCPRQAAQHGDRGPARPQETCPGRHTPEPRVRV